MSFFVCFFFASVSWLFFFTLRGLCLGGYHVGVCLKGKQKNRNPFACPVLTRNMAMQFNGEPPYKWLTDMHPHLNKVHQGAPYSDSLPKFRDHGDNKNGNDKGCSGNRSIPIVPGPANRASSFGLEASFYHRKLTRAILGLMVKSTTLLSCWGPVRSTWEASVLRFSP